MANIQENVQMQWNDSQNDGEVICGINDSDCSIFQTNHHTSITNNDTSVMNNGIYERSNEMYAPGMEMQQHHQLDVVAGFNTDAVQEPDNQPVVQDFVEIQVTEEEVVSDNWSLDHTGVVVADVKPRIDTGQSNDEVEIPLPQDQDLYSQMHPFPCDFCSRRFSKKSTLMAHMISHKSSEDLHDCNLCGAKYRRKFDLVNHMKIHAYAPDRSAMEEDDDDFPREKPLNTHKGRRKKSLVPKKNSVSSNSELSPDHFDIKSVKKPGKHRIIKKGNKILSSKTHNYVDEDMRLLSEMSRNANIVHQVPRWPVVDQSRPYVCQHCGVGFAREKALASHSRIHAGDSPFECDVCGEMFWDVSLLREHGRAKHPHLDSSPAGSVYTGDDRFGNFFCEICGVAFHRMDLLKRHRRHMVSHRDKAVVCSDCGDEFPDGRALLSHRHSHNANSNSLPARSFPCHDCGKTFGSRSSQQIHVRIHTGERPYGCRFCWKAFADGGTLRKHERIHTGEKPYVCPVCPKAFNQRVVLREHIRAHHSGADSKVNSCYECKVCGYLFGSSSELCLHLVQHSDENTAKHRQPSLGPRKYKRRRKLISHDIPNMTPMHDDDESTISSDSVVEKKKIINKKKYKSESNQAAQDLDSVVKQCESALQNINSMVVKSEPKEKKSKIDKTLKKHKTKNVGKLFKVGRNEKRAKAAKLLNNTSYASKYVVSRPDDLKPFNNSEPVRPRTKNVTFPLLDDLVDAMNGSDSMRNRPRTKNVNFRNLTVTKLEPATFPVGKTRKKNKSRKPISRKQKVETSVINGSNQIDSYSRSGGVSQENLETCIVPDFNIEGIKTEIPTEEETTILPMDSCIVKSELITCEMCTELFADRAQLLNHIRIHI